jgi:hypothetical protein
MMISRPWISEDVTAAGSRTFIFIQVAALRDVADNGLTLNQLGRVVDVTCVTLNQ